MKETRELQKASEKRDAAFAALTATSGKLRGRLSPRLLAADVAQLLAAKAGSVFLKRGITRRRRIAAAVGGTVAIVSAIALRAAQKTADKKSGDLPPE